jgi:hypothetical protein
VPSVRPPLDLETVLVAELEQDAELGALVGGPGNAARISTELPSTFTAGEARVRLERVGGGPVGWPDHLDRALVNFHVYGPTSEEAWSVAAELVRAVFELEGRTVAGGVLTAVERLLGPAWLPDPDADNAPRYLVQYALTGHPAAA